MKKITAVSVAILISASCEQKKQYIIAYRDSYSVEKIEELLAK